MRMGECKDCQVALPAGPLKQLLKNGQTREEEDNNGREGKPRHLAVAIRYTQLIRYLCASYESGSGRESVLEREQ